MTDVLTWTIGRRLELAKRAELLRKELGELELEVARLEAAEVVFGQVQARGDPGHEGQQGRRRALIARAGRGGVQHVFSFIGQQRQPYPPPRPPGASGALPVGPSPPALRPLHAQLPQRVHVQERCL